MIMVAKLIVPLTVALLCSWPLAVRAQEKSAQAAAPIPAHTLTREQFISLPSSAVIESDNERITKGEFLARRKQELERATKAMKKRPRPDFETLRKALLDREKAKLVEANRKVEAEVARLKAADARAHGPNWEARKKQALELLVRAARARPTESSELRKQAADLLAPAAK
jgi:hypothetical protein